MRRVTFRVTYPPERAHPIHRRVVEGTGVTEMALLAWGPTAAVTTLSWFDAERSVVEPILADTDVVETAHLREQDGGTYAFTYQETFALDPAVMAVIERARVAFLAPVTFEDDGTAQFEAVGERAALSEFYDELAAELPSEIEQVRAFDRQPGRGALTDRQREALEVALSVGYYEVPRTATVADVAGDLGCASSTAGELLRKAERALITTVVESGDSR